MAVGDAIGGGRIRKECKLAPSTCEKIDEMRRRAYDQLNLSISDGQEHIKI